MRTLTAVLCAMLLVQGFAQEKLADEPTNEKAQKAFKEGLSYLHERMYTAALDSFKKADKLEAGRCRVCENRIIQIGEELREWKPVENAAEEIIGQAQQPRDAALAHCQFGTILFDEGIDRHKDELFNRAHDEYTKALTVAPRFPAAVFQDGRALAYLKQDEAAKKRFQQFIEMNSEDSPDRQRALLYIAEPELARALMAPPFAVTTLDGKKISLDELQGKVVLMDFWATWCQPCREALPRIREIAKKFDGQPLIVLSVSVDQDETKWKEFVASNEMTWPQYFDNGFSGPLAKTFGVQAIPHTFTIDADGILQDEQIGDASIEGKLKKLVKRVQEKHSDGKTSQ